MKGVLLAGGTGTRLRPMTLVTNKHLLPVYDTPMIYYPLHSLKVTGCTDIMVISGGDSIGDVMNLLGDGSQFGVELTYRVQTRADGIAGALKLAENFCGKERVVVILGDNVFHGMLPIPPSEGASIILKEVTDAGRFGVAEVDGSGKVISIEEKPKEPKSNLAVTGIYFFDETLWDKLDSLQVSSRGEYEITDVNNLYIKEGRMSSTVFTGYWSDAGTPHSLMNSSRFVEAIGGGPFK